MQILIQMKNQLKLKKKYNMINEQNKNKEEVAKNSNKIENNKEETKK